eukprot:TRINITY_DN30238_c0_g1_i1.p2 TRINITY_DN30238_c0_g1~~TRINITY_DN30238_c0_g1_i1.p2  ORF type:complete len:192 (-),score=26.11 TRINITY_DN30238_c0_g1_i1:391-966(-)
MVNFGIISCGRAFCMKIIHLLPGQTINARTDSKWSRFGPFSAYDTARAAYGHLIDLGCFHRFKEIMDERADFFDNRIADDTFFTNCKTLIGTMLKVQDAHPANVFEETLLVGLEFVTPLIDSSEHGPFLFNTCKEKVLNLLGAPVIGRVLAKKQQRTRRRGVGEEEIGDAQPDPQKKKRRVTRAQAAKGKL